MNKYTQSTYIKKGKKKRKDWIGILAVVALWFFSGYGALTDSNVHGETISVDKAQAVTIEEPPAFEVKTKEAVEKPAYKTRIAKITGYNTVEAQTDQTPCISSSGHNICGRNDVVACPRSIKLGTKVEIGGKMYVCLDRLAAKYDNRFDISCDKDMACPYKVTGTKEVRIYE